MCEPWQDPPQDHPKGLVHGTGIAICSDKDSFYLPFFTQTHLYVLTNSVGLTQKIKDQALILKLGKSTSQEDKPQLPSEGPGHLWKLGIKTIVGSLHGGQKNKK